MNPMNQCERTVSGRSGQALVEYALLLGMLLSALLASLILLGWDTNLRLEESLGVAFQPVTEQTAAESPPVAASPSVGLTSALVLAAVPSEQTSETSRTFYVDAQAGDDSRSGLTADTAWQTITKVNGTALAPGDSVLFKRGCTWREQLVVPSSGAAGAPIRFGAYGAGGRPRINGADRVAGWSRFADAVWSAPLVAEPCQVFFDGVRGVSEADKQLLNVAREWCWDARRLYVYSATDPAAAYRSEGVEASVRYGLFAWQKNNIAIEELEVVRGEYGVYLGGGSSDVSCTAVDAGWNFYDGLMVDGATCGNVTFANCTAHDNDRHGLQAHAASNVVVSGGRYYGNAQQYGAGVGFNAARGGRVSGVEAWGNYYGIKTANAVTAVSIADNVVRDNLSCGIDLDSGTQQSTVERNAVYGNGSHGIVVEWNSRDCAVLRNLCHDNGPQHAGIFVEMATNVTVSYNVIHSEYIGIRFNAGASGCAAYNNVAHNIGGVAFSAFNNCSDITLKNNIASACAYLAVHVRPDSQSGFTADHNDWFVNGAQLEWGWDRLSFLQWQAASTQDAHSLSADPLFTASSGMDFHLQAGSPCIDAGSAVGLATDYEGTRVPQGAAPDMGAFEWSAVATGPVHDVAVSSVEAPVSAQQGDRVAVVVHVTNQGDEPETFNVSVTESPGGWPLGTQAVTALAPAAAASVVFEWDTSGASLGNHALRATAGALAGETDLADNSAQATVQVRGRTPTLHVTAIDMAVARKGRTIQATAAVKVVDDAGVGVAGATVYGQWTGAAVASQSAVTNAAGRATFSAKKSRTGSTFTFTVTNVKKSGYVYDPAQNVETSDSVTAT